MSRPVFQIAFAIFFTTSANAQIQSTQNILGTSLPGGLQMSASADMLGQSAAKRFDVREAEISFFAPTDAWWQGTLTGAAHLENGLAGFELHEAYIGSSKLIPRVRGRAGLFFLGVGRLNRFHRHDWVFPSAPRVQSTFFDAEGAADTGAEMSWLLPLPVYLDWTVGMTNGWNFGHAHTQGEAPLVPTHYTRLATSIDLPGDGASELGLNYLGRVTGTQTASTAAYLIGLDWTAKWREGRRLAWLFQSEAWWRAIRSQPLVADEDQLGVYGYLQYGMGPFMKWGVRVDHFAVTNVAGSPAYWTVMPTWSYDFSEFSRLRVALSNEWPTQEKNIEVQFTYLLGAHPSHDF
jgi:hypothetical protein